MNCQQCGSVIDPTDSFCQNCGAKNKNASATIAVSPVNEAVSQPQTVEEVSSFFKNNFFGLVKSVLTKPIEGTKAIFVQAGHESYQHALILIFTTGIAVILLNYLFLGSEIDFMPKGMFLKAGIIASIILFIISILTYFVKTLSGKPDFKKELLTGGICGIPVILFTCYYCLFGSSVFGGFESFDFSGMLFIHGMVIIYFFLMLVNIVMQSLRASNSNDAVCWYVSPVIIILSFYLGIRIGTAIFFN